MRKNPLSIVFVNLSLFLGLCFIWVGMDYLFDWQINLNGSDRVYIFLLSIIFTVGTVAEVFGAVKKLKEDADGRKVVADLNAANAESKELPEDQWCDTDEKADVPGDDDSLLSLNADLISLLTLLLNCNVAVYCTHARDPYTYRVALVYKDVEIYAFMDSDIVFCLDRVLGVNKSHWLKCIELIDAGQFKGWVEVFDNGK